MCREVNRFHIIWTGAERAIAVRITVMQNPICPYLKSGDSGICKRMGSTMEGFLNSLD